MNFPFSKEKWLSLGLAAAVMVTAGTSWAADGSTVASPAKASEAQPAAQNTADQRAANQQETLTIQQAVEIALEKNAQLQALRLDVSTANTNAKLAYSATKDLSDEFITSLDTAQLKHVNNARAEMAKVVNELYLKATEKQIALGAKQAYYNLLHAQANLELSKQSLSRAEAQLKVAQAAFEVGTRAKTDVLQAEAGLAGAQAALAAAEMNVEVARLKLNQFIGAELTQQWVLSPVTHSEEVTTTSLTDALNKAISQRAEIKQKEEEIKVAELNVDLIDRFSSLGTYQGQVAKNEVEKAKLELEQKKREIQVEVTQAYHTMNTAQKAIESYKKAKDAAAENYRLTNLRFENGMATTLEVTQMEEELTNREIQYQKALHDYNLAVAAFENSLGN